MENQKRSKGTTALIVLLLLVTMVALILATYAWAKYTASFNGNATANVAKWNVNISDDGNFVGTYQHVVSGEIAPGTSGSFDIVITPNDTEVCIAVDMALSGITYSPNTISDIEHLKFFADNAYTTELPKGGTSINLGTIDLNSGSTHTSSGFQSLTNGTYTHTIYWVWPYDRADADAKSDAYDSIIQNEATDAAYDAVDNAIGAGATSMTVNYTVTAYQVQPVAQ